MKGVIASFRGSRRRKKHRQMIVEIEGITSKEQAENLKGKVVIWNSPGKKGKQIKGVIAQPHGVKGRVRVHFEKGLPGQALGQEVSIV